MSWNNCVNTVYKRASAQHVGPQFSHLLGWSLRQLHCYLIPLSQLEWSVVSSVPVVCTYSPSDVRQALEEVPCSLQVSLEAHISLLERQ